MRLLTELKKLFTNQKEYFAEYDRDLEIMESMSKEIDMDLAKTQRKMDWLECYTILRQIKNEVYKL